MESKQGNNSLIQHTFVEFKEIGLIFDSNFDSGNLLRVEKLSNENFELFVASDCEDLGIKTESYCVWFHFKVYSKNDMKLNLAIKKLSSFLKDTFSKGHCPVYHIDGMNDGKEYDRKWIKFHKIENNVNFVEDKEGIDLNFTYRINAGETVYFAYSYPWSYNDNLVFIKTLKLSLKSSKWIYFNSEIMIDSLEQRKIHYITLSSTKNQMALKEKTINKHLFKKNPNKRPFIFMDKKYIVISARVHPAETPSSFALQGAIEYILKNPLLLDSFVFVIIPMLNPDGVFRGYYRLDTNGKNLNRVYHSSYFNKYPSIFALKKIINHLNNEQRLHAYFDFHAHNLQQKSFLYGNKGETLEDLVKIKTIPKIMSLISNKFDYLGCKFESKGIFKTIAKKENENSQEKIEENNKNLNKNVSTSKPEIEEYKNIDIEKKENLDDPEKNFNDSEETAQKEVFPIAKTYFFKNESLHLSYTFECSYNENSYIDPEKQDTEIFGRNGFKEIGSSLMQSLLEFFEINQKSILEQHGYKSLQELKDFIKKNSNF